MNKDDELKNSGFEKVEEVIESLAASLVDHPGFMWAGSGFEVLHADWPAYPSGHGFKNALVALADYPAETRFFPIDHIDLCTLFVVGHRPKDNEYDKNLYHIAIWDEDLQECARRGFIEGVSVDGQYIELGDYIVLSEAGLRAILIYELTYDIDPAILDRVEDLLHMTRYDDAVRNATILIETNLRNAINGGNSDYGQRLVDKCFGESGLLITPGLTNASRLEIHSAFRRLFKYVRNDFAHRFHSIDIVTVTRLLRRCSHLLELLDMLKKRLADSSKSV